MRTHSAIRTPRSLPALLALALALACQAQPSAPAPKPTPAAQPAPAPAPELAAPAPAPEPPPVPIPEGCKVIIEGQDGDTVKRALVNTTAGGLYDTTVDADGRVIEFECPPAAERKGANIIAEKSNAELVHWAGVDLAPGDQAQPLAATDAKPDLPEGLDEATLARLRAKWPDLSKWEEPAVEAAPEQPAAPEDKIPVSFSAHQLYWAELRLEHRESKKQLRVVLDPKASKSLLPGVYELSVKIEDTGNWLDAGELTIEVGKGKYTVKMLDNPPRPQVSSN